MDSAVVLLYYYAVPQQQCNIAADHKNDWSVSRVLLKAKPDKAVEIGNKKNMV